MGATEGKHWIRFTDGELPAELKHLERSELLIMEGGPYGVQVLLSLGPEVSAQVLEAYRKTTAEYAARVRGRR